MKVLRPFNKVKKRLKKVDELSTFFNLSFLQVKLDNKGIVTDEYILKLITLDKILKLYFDSYVCCHYTPYPEVLLTREEIEYLTTKKDSNLVYIKKSIISIVNTYKANNDLSIFFMADDDWDDQKNKLKALLLKVL